MKKIALGKTGLLVPNIAVGCMRIHDIEKALAERFLENALARGANFFDHADIYGGGVCEERFADAIHMTASLREKIIIQSKCGIRPGIDYNSTKDYIVTSVDNSLKRLKTDYLDILLIHRPDPLMEPEEVAEAFEILHNSGKVRYFGVSNFNPMQIQLLQKYVKQPLHINQLQFSITNANMISQGLHVNMSDEDAVNRDGSVLDFCRLNDMTIQPWSPFQHGFFNGVFLGNEKFPELNAAIDKIAEKYGVSSTTIALAWILRHPAHMQPIVGTMNTSRFNDCVKASELYLDRSEWFGIYKAAGNTLP
ncbi:aldo/keto reductase [[Clostridium] polysaccharolyticum]|uniref:Predicted oxidoreductase n=1 Tax=[Clostridium] polysaccharolyticum TaxID=29364 RepID=A0A1I0G360_9FIRM|nr:aldo/keto reductase [[Clostridium] polysaccharolyticum]SET64320.1 Predicted oxidoreductase [[Clostridium] polysaccharolyticum]